MKDDFRRSSNTTTKSGYNSFIHKLYTLLEDEVLDDLIWWSDDGISFHIKPVEEFSQMLSRYFKHTNITSFVRQLNIYGFHKINNFIDTTILDNVDYKTTVDDSRTSSNNKSNNNNSNSQKTKSSNNSNGVEPIKIWEFRHSTNLFRKGDTVSLKYIKRRSPSSKNIYSLANNSSGNNNNIFQQKHNSSDNPLFHDNRFRFISSHSETSLNHYPHNQQLYINDNTLKHCSPIRTVSNEYDPSIISPHNPYPYHHYQSYPQPNPHSQSHVSSSSLPNSNMAYKVKQDTLIEDLKDTNLDMLKLVDLLGLFISILSDSNVNKNDVNLPNQYGNLQNDLQIFKQNIINRWNKNIDIYQSVLSSLNNNNSNSNNNINNNIDTTTLQQQKVVPVVHGQSVQTIVPTTVAGTGIPTAHVVGYYPYHPPIPFNQPYVIQNTQPSNTSNYPINQTFHNKNEMTMMNPFENGSGSTKRNMSVFIDPLTPVAHPNSTGTPSLIKPDPINNTKSVNSAIATTTNTKLLAHRGSSVSSVSIASIVDPHRRTPESLLKETFDHGNSSNISKSNISRNTSPLVNNIDEETKNRLSSIKQEQTRQCITPQSSVSLGKDEKGYINLGDTTTNDANETRNNNDDSNTIDNIGTNNSIGNNQKVASNVQNHSVHSYTVKDILNDETSEYDDSQSDGHINKKIKTTN
ncbi:hypothetical protein RI543_000311 [Arxiozyma heterogenica]|uniref:HSF-type DNA-binding domain-containing protein n=1 Tax=Arxiozyma heterogenica TaxID=278026 RepID=A0AAN7WKM9_9SACH|nr:hypothetical protein RI543_000311 [Kazachstania heterogenica]